MTMPDYYRILQVDPQAEEEVIEAAYRRLARKYHPDVYAGPDAAERMRELNLAYSVLRDSIKRQEYDAAREQEFVAQVQLVAQRISGQQRAVTREDLERYAKQARRAREETPTDPESPAVRGTVRRPDIHQAPRRAPVRKASTGSWPVVKSAATRPLPRVPAAVYRRPFSDTLLEEAHHLAEGLLAIGLLGYPMLAALCWFPLHALSAYLGFDDQMTLIVSLGLPLLLILPLSWWFGRRISHRR
jgi:hypothetical protein